MSKHPKEEAERIVALFDYKVKDYDGEIALTRDEAIQCALICIDEMINLINTINNDGADDYYDELLEVKEHINKM